MQFIARNCLCAKGKQYWSGVTGKKITNPNIRISNKIQKVYMS